MFVVFINLAFIQCYFFLPNCQRCYQTQIYIIMGVMEASKRILPNLNGQQHLWKKNFIEFRFIKSGRQSNSHKVLETLFSRVALTFLKVSYLLIIYFLQWMVCIYCVISLLTFQITLIYTTLPPSCSPIFFYPHFSYCLQTPLVGVWLFLKWMMLL